MLTECSCFRPQYPDISRFASSPPAHAQPPFSKNLLPFHLLILSYSLKVCGLDLPIDCFRFRYHSHHHNPTPELTLCPCPSVGRGVLRPAPTLAMMTARSSIRAPSPNMSFDRGHSYFPDQQQPTDEQQQQQQQQQQHPPPQPQYFVGGPDAETRSNTLANTHLPQAGHDHIATAPHPARFNDEWDAGQRGSSIVDGTRPHSTMYRTNSYAGSVNGLSGDGTTSISRSNTLKKKASLRRSGSLKRSGSRRSMKAGSVRSLALQPNPDQEEMNSAFYCPVPTAGSPTDVLANRFQGTNSYLSTSKICS